MISKLMGSILGIYVSFRVGFINLSAIFIITSFMLFYYSLKYKRLLLWGNLVVAFLSAFVMLLPWLFEFFTLLKRPTAFIEHANCLEIIRNASLLFFGFSFLMTLIREWIKDMEDRVGDESGGRVTLPIHFGIKKSKMIITVFIILFVAILAVIQWVLLVNKFDYVSYYSIITISFPLLYIALKLGKAVTSSDYHFLSTVSKIIMFFGIMLLVISYLTIFKFQY